MIPQQQTPTETWYGIKDTKDDVLVRDRGDTRPYMRKLKTTAEREIDNLCAQDKSHDTSKYEIVKIHIQYSIEPS